MSEDLSKFIKVYKNFFEEKFCIDTVSQLEKLKWDKHQFYDYSANSLLNNLADPDVCYEDIINKKLIHQKLWYALEQYILKDFNHYKDWFSGWSGYSDIRFNKYSESTEMKLHCDHIHSLFDGERKGIPILSVVGLLNEEFEGGEFIMFKNNIINLSRGDVMIFPSSFMFPHKISPIKAGVRYSFVSWAW